MVYLYIIPKFLVSTADSNANSLIIFDNYYVGKNKNNGNDTTRKRIIGIKTVIEYTGE